MEIVPDGPSLSTGTTSTNSHLDVHQAQHLGELDNRLTPATTIYYICSPEGGRVAGVCLSERKSRKCRIADPVCPRD